MSKNNSKLLINEPPLQVLPTLATKIGLNEAIVLQQVHYWLVISEKAKDERKYKDGRWWVYNSYVEWQENFPWWSLPTIKRTIYHLEETKLLISKEMNAQDWDHTKWYSIDYELLNGLTDSIKMTQSNEPKWTNPTDQNDTLLIESETTTETTTEKGVLSEKEKADANALVTAIIENGKKAKYQNRNLMPEQYILLCDVYVELTGQSLSKRVLQDWMHTFMEWTDEGLQPDHIRAAYKHATRPDGGFLVGRPGSLTNTAVALKSKPTAPEEHRPEYEKVVYDPAVNKPTPRPDYVPRPNIQGVKK